MLRSALPASQCKIFAQRWDNKRILPRAGPDQAVSLSRRESQVIEVISKGLSRAEISDRLGVSRKCVNVFIERARGKFRSKRALQLGHLAIRLAMFADKRTR
jgi:DNA-binding CsgD family transcriptional regulator